MNLADSLGMSQRSRKARRSNKAVKRAIWYDFFGTSSQALCYWCACELAWHEATVDHEPALALGGTWDKAVLACGPCNKKRGRVVQLLCAKGGVPMPAYWIEERRRRQEREDG